MADNRPIGVFDSGLGGLTVVKQLKRLLPQESIVYFGDTGRVPYGTRSNGTILKYAKEDEAFLISQNVKMIVAACGTVSSVAYSTAKDLPVDFVEVVSPAAKSAAEITKNGRIGVIGTPATIKSGSYAKAIHKILPDAEVIATACPLFVPLVEEGWINSNDSVVVETAKRYLEIFKNSNIDTLIMGCTHYPALQNVLQSVLGPNVSLINMGTAAAKQVKQILNDKGMLSMTEPEYKYFVSDRADSFSKIANILLGENIEGKVKQVQILQYIKDLK